METLIKESRYLEEMLPRISRCSGRSQSLPVVTSVSPWGCRAHCVHTGPIGTRLVLRIVKDVLPHLAIYEGLNTGNAAFPGPTRIFR